MDAQKIFNLHFPDKLSLRAHYMPFLDGGGLFIPTSENYSPGDKVFLVLEFLEEPDMHSVTGVIVWLVPSGAQNQRLQGIGVRFLGENHRTREKIEELLAGDLETGSNTLTF